MAARGRGARSPGSALMPLLLVAPLLVYMVVFYALPVISMLLRSVSESSLDAVATTPPCRDDTVFLNTFWNTLYTGDRSSRSGTLLLGYPVALGLVRARRSAPLILIMILLPFWTSILVRSYAWMVLMGRHGLINEALLAGGLIERPLAHPQHAARGADRDDPHPAALHDPADRQCAAPDRSLAGARGVGPGMPRHGIPSGK